MVLLTVALSSLQRSQNPTNPVSLETVRTDYPVLSVFPGLPAHPLG